MSVCFRLVSIISVQKAFDWGERPASQSKDLCRTNGSLSDKGTARCYLAITKIRGGKFFVKTLKTSATVGAEHSSTGRIAPHLPLPSFLNSPFLFRNSFFIPTYSLTPWFRSSLRYGRRKTFVHRTNLAPSSTSLPFMPFFIYKIQYNPTCYDHHGDPLGS